MRKVFIMASVMAALRFGPVWAGESAAGPDTPPAGPQMPPAGTVTYSLPSTSLSFEVEAVQEKFYAGPYARYAAKYLGMEVRQKDAVSYRLSGVTMTPHVEADHSERYLLDFKGTAAKASFLKLTSAGLVSAVDQGTDRDFEWRFPIVADSDYAGKGLTANLTTEAATLYRKDAVSHGRMAVRQDMLVEKSEEKRAAEIADIIFSLRKQRMDIITGNTDATYSGEAMDAAIREMRRLEEEYLTLFTGYSEYGTQKLGFELVPDKDRDNQIYIAFRISDSAGLLPADNLSGKPVVLEIVPETFAVPEVPKKTKESKVQVLRYRIPATCQVKLSDGMDVIMQGRVQIYQLGITESLPVNIETR